MSGSPRLSGSRSKPTAAKSTLDIGNMKHTPTPWKVQPTRGKQSAIDRKWEIVAPVEGGETVVVGEHTGVDCLKKAVAEHICRCVNMHDELVAALEEIAADNPDDISDRDELIRCAGIARAVLARL
jgi:hypothetical protein